MQEGVDLTPREGAGQGRHGDRTDGEGGGIRQAVSQQLHMKHRVTDLPHRKEKTYVQITDFKRTLQ